MPQVSTAIGTLNFCPPAVRVGQPFNCARNLFIEAWPAAARLELTLGTVKGRAAAPTDVFAFFPEGEKLPCERGLSALVNDDSFFFFG